MKYEAIAHYANANVVCETNEFETLMKFVKEHENAQCDIIDGFTGEIRAMFNSANDFCDEELMYAAIGWGLAQSVEGVESFPESEPEPEPFTREDLMNAILEACEEFGATFGVPHS